MAGTLTSVRNAALDALWRLGSVVKRGGSKGPYRLENERGDCVLSARSIPALYRAARARYGDELDWSKLCPRCDRMRAPGRTTCGRASCGPGQDR